MKVTAISGYRRKGPACFLVELAGRRLMLDLGEGPDHAMRPDLDGVGAVDALFLSHAHRDHVGALDWTERVGYPTIYATGLTAERSDAAAFGPVQLLPLTGISWVLGLEVLTGSAGHAPGAVWMRIGGAGGLLYTGDYCSESVLFAMSPLPPARALICDASYGAFDDALPAQFDKLVSRAEQGPVLLPAPASGRGLEIAVALHEGGLRVALCPAHRALARKLAAHEEISQPTQRRLIAALASADALEALDAPMGVMIAATPNADAGLSAQLCEAWADRADLQVVFTGHVAKGTPAERLVATGRASRLRWNVHPRLRDLLDSIEAVRPELVLPAFCGPQDLATLKRALPVPVAGPQFSLPA